MKFQREIATEYLFAEMMPLLEKHFVEISANKDIPLNPDFKKYLALEAANYLRAYTARLADGTLVGYAVFFIMNNAHYADSLQANQDVIFIDPAHRGTGAKLIMFCDKELASEGVQVVYHHVKIEHDFGPMLVRMGYKAVDVIYSKRLDKEKS